MIIYFVSLFMEGVLAANHCQYAYFSYYCFGNIEIFHLFEDLEIEETQIAYLTTIDNQRN